MNKIIYEVYSQKEFDSLKIDRPEHSSCKIRILFGTVEHPAQVDPDKIRSNWNEFYIGPGVCANLSSTSKNIYIIEDNTTVYCKDGRHHIIGQNVQFLSHGEGFITFTSHATFGITAFNNGTIGFDDNIIDLWPEVVNNKEFEGTPSPKEKREIWLYDSSSAINVKSCTILAENHSSILNPIASKISTRDNSSLTIDKKECYDNEIQATSFSVVNICVEDFLSGNKILCNANAVCRMPNPPIADSHWVNIDRDVYQFLDEQGIKYSGGKATVYKVVIKDDNKYYKSIYDWDFLYSIGKIVIPRKSFNSNKGEECASGIHCGSLEWVKNYKESIEDTSHDGPWAILELEIDINDILIPYTSDGKIRVPKAKVIREYT